MSLEICEGSSVTVGTNVYTTSGVYSDTLLSSSGCESVVNLTLTVVPRIINNLSLEICEGSSVTVGTNVYTTSGVYSDTLLSSSGCDSVVALALTVVPRIINNLSLEICEGSSVTVGTNVYTTSGVYSDTLLSSSGCDSVVNLTLTVVSRIINNLSLEICEGSSVTVGANVYTTFGVYSDTLLSSSGCDSVVNLTLTVVSRIINNLSLEICEGSSVTVGTNVYTTSGVYSDTLLSSSGCDSVVNLTLTVVSRIINNLSLEICEGSSVTVGTNVYTTSGVYSDTLLSSSGCDSVVNLTLTVVSRIINNLSLEICEGSKVLPLAQMYIRHPVF
ncbi:MAG: hypothetical protein IPJ22_09985 [Bacteroidetes bacterium]|nr:hypothetical protein [Bacteroidota bacterium]